MIKTYLKIRNAVFLMAHPILYVAIAVIAILAHDFSGSNGVVWRALCSAFESVKDLASWLFFSSRGRENPDLLGIVAVLMPSIFALAWCAVERVTGVHYMLKKKNSI